MQYRYEEILISELEADIKGISDELATLASSVGANPLFIGAATAGTGALAIALTVVSLPVSSAMASVASAMAIASGIGGVGVGIAQILGGITGQPLRVQQKEIDRALSIGGSPIALSVAAIAGATGGPGIASNSVEVASFMEAIFTLKKGLRSVTVGEDTYAGDLLLGALGLAKADYEQLGKVSHPGTSGSTNSSDRVSAEKVILRQTPTSDEIGPKPSPPPLPDTTTQKTNADRERAASERLEVARAAAYMEAKAAEDISRKENEEAKRDADELRVQAQESARKEAERAGLERKFEEIKKMLEAGEPERKERAEAAYREAQERMADTAQLNNTNYGSGSANAKSATESNEPATIYLP